MSHHATYTISQAYWVQKCTAQDDRPTYGRCRVEGMQATRGRGQSLCGSIRVDDVSPWTATMARRAPALSRLATKEGVPMNRLGQRCPACGTWSTIRNSEDLSTTLRATFFQCRNLYCGASWKSHLEIIYFISPPSIQPPGLNIPNSPRSEIMRRIAALKTDPRQGSLLDHE